LYEPLRGSYSVRSFFFVYT